MKFLKTLSAIMLAGFLSMSVNASMIGGVEFGEGEISIVTDVYFNTDVAAGTELVSQGVGQVLQIRDSTGLIWDSITAGVEMNFMFDGIQLYDNGTTGTGAWFTDILGSVDFYSNTLNTFQATGNFANDKAAITNSGEYLLGALGHPVGPDAWTVAGSTTDDGISGNGQLDILYGSAFDLIVQDQIILSDGSLADMTFNFSGDTLGTNGYNWGGSADFSTVSAVPAPAALWLFAPGMMGLLGMQHFKRKDEDSLEA